MIKDIEKGIGNLLGYESPETKRVRDLYYLDKVKRIIEGPPTVQPPRPTPSEKIPHVSLKTTPSLSPSVNTKEAEVARGAMKFIRRPKVKPMKITDYVNKMNHLYSNEPKPTNEKTIQQLEALKKWSQPTPVGLGNKYKSNIRTPVEHKRQEYKAKVEANKTKIETNKGGYTPWYERMAAEEAENLNQIKRTSWEQGGKVNPEPKYVTAQDVQKVYEPKQPEATPLQMKQLHQRLQNHNERTGEFKSTVEKPSHKPRYLHNPSTGDFEDTYDPNWGNDIK